MRIQLSQRTLVLLHGDRGRGQSGLFMKGGNGVYVQMSSALSRFLHGFKTGRCQFLCMDATALQKAADTAMEIVYIADLHAYILLQPLMGGA